MLFQSNEISIFRSLSTADIFNLFLILVSSFLLIKFIRYFIPWFAESLPGKRRLNILAIMPILRIIIIIFAVILVFPIIIEPTTENLIAFLGALGIALGFALKEYISSLIAGVVVLYEMPFKPGDWVDIGGIYGEVKSIGLRSIEILTPDDTTVRIPQLKIWDTPIFNASGGSREILCITEFFLHPKHNAYEIKQTLYDVALTSPYLQPKKPIQVVVMEKPWGTHYKLKAYPIDARDQFSFITDLTIRGKEALLKLNVEFVTLVHSIGEK